MAFALACNPVVSDSQSSVSTSTDGRLAAGACPLVSVCVPTYNDARFLPQCLASILAQTYPHFELVVCDDASSDDTPAVVASFADRRTRSYRNDHNVGQFDNMNRCIELAHGRVVALYHSDDIYEPTIVEEEVRFLIEHPEAGAVFALDTWIDSNGHCFGQTRLPPGLPDPAELTLPDVITSLMRHKNHVLRGPSFMARSEVLADVGRFEPTRFSIQGDLDYYLRLLSRYPIGIVAKPLLRYRQDVTQVSTGYFHLRTEEEHFFEIVDRCVAANGLDPRIDGATRTEYEFHRADDRTTRAANFVILGDPAAAQALLTGSSFPWSTFGNGITRRKVRVALLRQVLRTGLALRAGWLLAPVLSRSEHPTWRRRDVG